MYGRYATLAFLLLLAGCASGYKEFYRPTQGINLDTVSARRPELPPATPMVERAQPGNGEALLDAYARRGYIMIGQSLFNSGRRQSEDSAVRQAQDVGADLVVILNPRYTGSVTSSVPITTPTISTSYSSGTATAYGAGGTVTAYGSGTTTTYGTATSYMPIVIHRSDYGALYFVKQRFPLGIFFRDLNDGERQELQTNKGVVARLVVDRSPAFDADVLPGDVLTGIDGIAILGVRACNQLLGERQGKLVSLSIVRRGQRIEKTVQLGR